MKKQFNVNMSRFQVPFYGSPLVADNINAYEIVLTAPEDITGCSFEVVATRADGEKFIGLGSCKGNTASYVMDNQMHAVEGDLSVRVSVVDSDGSCLTTNELLFTVIKGNGSDHAVAGTNVGLLTQILVKISKVEQETDEKITRVKTDASKYTDAKIQEVELKAEKTVPAYNSYKKSLLVSRCCENAVSTDEISSIEYYEEYETNFCIYGNLSVDMHGSEYVFFNPETDVCFVAKLITSYPGDEKELDLHIEEDLSEMSLDEFKATYPFYGVYVQNKWEPVEVLFKQLEDGAKAYTNERIGDTFIANETIVETDNINVYEVDLSDEPKLISEVVVWDDGDVDYEYHMHADVYLHYEDGTSYVEKTNSLLATYVMKNPYKDKQVIGISVMNGDSNYMIVEYTWFSKESASVKEYVDHSIHQAILESWEVGV